MFNAEISAGSLLLPESRRLARLLRTKPTPEAWDAALYEEDLLHKNPATAKRPAAQRTATATSKTSRSNGFALDMSMGGPDADDADFRESA